MTATPRIIDTNVVVSGVLTRDPASPTARIVDGMLKGQFRFIISVELLAEYRDVLLREKIRRRHALSEAGVDIFLTEIAANGILVEPSAEKVKGEDAHILRILSTEPTAVLVTGDRRLAQSLPRGMRSVTPRQLLTER